MGSQPWKRELMDRWEDTFSGQQVRVTTAGIVYSARDWEPTGEREICGMFSGQGSSNGRPCVVVNVAPAEMGVRDAGYFDHERWIVVDRSVSVAALGDESDTRIDTRAQEDPSS